MFENFKLLWILQNLSLLLIVLREVNLAWQQICTNVHNIIVTMPFMRHCLLFGNSLAASSRSKVITTTERRTFTQTHCNVRPASPFGAILYRIQSLCTRIFTFVFSTCTIMNLVIWSLEVHFPQQIATMLMSVHSNVCPSVRRRSWSHGLEGRFYLYS